jgi:hypothetical protein
VTNPVSPPAEQPERSRVAPVGHDIRESRDDFSDNIKKLLAGLEPTIASEAIARAETLGRLPPAQQTLLRCALAAASQTFKKAEIVHEELTRVKDRQRRADTALSAESVALARRSALAEAQVAGLREDLAASEAASRIREARARKRNGYLWLALAATVSAGIVYASLFSRAAPPADSSASEVILYRPAKLSATPRPNPDPAVEQSLDRLDGALARVPLPDVDSVLREANQWLLASRIPPCFVRSGQGEISLLVNMNARGAAPLRNTLVQCAQAAEHVTE